MQKTANRKTIAVDIDEVLAAFAESFVEFSNRRWGTHLTVDDWTEHWAEMWGVDYEEEKRRAIEIRGSDMFLNFRHSSEAKPVLQALKENHNLVIVTSRHRSIANQTTDWIDKHFNGLFDDIHFAGIWDDLEKPTAEKMKATKAEILTEIGADYLIDDQPKHCLAAAGAGITAVLFGDYKWNRETKLVKNMVRAKNWQEVLEFFHAESRQRI